VLALGQTCAETSLPNSGIEDSMCSILPEQPNTDLIGSPIPTSVSSITILELGQNLGTILTTEIPIDSAFISGQTFTYTSFFGTQEGLDTNEEFGTFPRGLELRISGRNLFSETIVNTFTIEFSNSCCYTCGIFPVVEEGDQIGWVKFVSFSVLLLYAYLALGVYGSRNSWCIAVYSLQGSLSDPLAAVCPEVRFTKIIGGSISEAINDGMGLFTIARREDATGSVLPFEKSLLTEMGDTDIFYLGQSLRIEAPSRSPTTSRAPTNAPMSSGHASNGLLPFMTLLVGASVAMAQLWASLDGWPAE
jgi:hypothetical protein